MIFWNYDVLAEVVGDARPYRPTITAECRSKWYRLIVVHTDGIQQTLDFCELEDYAPPGESAQGDHIVNPKAVAAYADSRGWDIDELAHEVITGRWELARQGCFWLDFLPTD